MDKCTGTAAVQWDAEGREEQPEKTLLKFWCNTYHCSKLAKYSTGQG